MERPDIAVELKRAIDELGLRGYKLFGPLTPIPFDDESLTPVWKLLAERGLPILIHFGLLGHAGGVVSHPNISPFAIFNGARHYPDIGFPRGYNYCYLQDQVRVVRDLRFSDPEIEAIFGNNARKLLRPEPYTPHIESRS